MTQQKGMTYAGTGVDYDAMDPFKRLAQMAGRATAVNLERFGFTEVEASRGESVYLIETPDCYLAHVEEGLGTKNWIAEDMYKLIGKSYYDQMAQDTVAMIVNDMITLGALPVSIAMHFAVGDSNWFKDEQRCLDLVDGWKKACDMAGCVWGGGETPTLKGMPDPVLAGSALGIIKPKELIIDPNNIQHGDAIIMLASSGIHANGLTMARKIADKLPDGYLTMLPDDRTYGETLLDPTPIYVPVISKCLELDVDLHYTINITGHGWRKLMRANGNFRYVVERLPPQLPIFDFLQEHGPVDDREAYGNFNMGAGFALYVQDDEVKKTLEMLALAGFDAWEAGHIEKSDTKQVIITPKDIVYDGSTLGVR
jgi:phosphoribosylformylglycinamidine cyclo-ligase